MLIHKHMSLYINIHHMDDPRVGPKSTCDKSLLLRARLTSKRAQTICHKLLTAAAVYIIQVM